jgi:ATP-dependent DNA helicase RecG
MMPMTASELQTYLLANYPVENEAHEWKAWRSIPNHAAKKAGEDIASYVSAISNMEGGTLVIGAEDKTLAIRGITDFDDYTADSLPFRLAGKCTHLPTEGLKVEEITTTDTNQTVWLVHIPKHAPRQPVITHGKAWQRIGDSLTLLRPERHAAILSEPLVGEDWSAGIVASASLSDLDSEAVAKAREKFAQRYQNERWAKDIASWTDAYFLDQAKLTVRGKMTRTALLLLGHEGSTHLLSPHPAEITWKIATERVVKHFSIPFILTTSAVAQHIRNPNIKLFPATELLATELPRYDNKVILEGLHNCIAHQDYERAGRIVIEEMVGRLRLSNQGGFIEGKPEDYFLKEIVPAVYRNPWLSRAMSNVGMGDAGGFGIKEMVDTQRKRFLPLPDFEGSTSTATVFNVYGQVIDENYSQLLMQRKDLPLEQVVWLDRIQKRLKVDDAQAANLRNAKLIEGRKPNWFVAASIAAITNKQNEYVLNKGFDDGHYKKLFLERLEKFGPTSGKQLSDLIWDKLPQSLSEESKEIKVKNLRTALRLHGLDGKRIEIDPAGSQRGSASIWRIKPDKVV